jgi:hypothetical protein
MTAGRLAIVLLVVGVVAVAVLYDPGVRDGLSGCWTAVREDVGPEEGADAFGGVLNVYVLRHGEYYHRRDCPRLEGEIPVRMSLEKARELLKPCPECNPPQ